MMHHPLRSFLQINSRCPLNVCMCNSQADRWHRFGCEISMCWCAYNCTGKLIILYIWHKQAFRVILLPYITNGGLMDRIIFMLLLHSTALNLQHLIGNLLLTASLPETSYSWVKMFAYPYFKMSKFYFILSLTPNLNRSISNHITQKGQDVGEL